MNYRVPDKPAEPKPRYVIVRDPVEIEAIKRNGLRDPAGYFDVSSQHWYAEAHSLAQYRGQLVQFVV